MSQIDWKKVDAEERYLYTHPPYPFVETHNWQAIIDEQRKINIHMPTNKHT